MAIPWGWKFMKWRRVILLILHFRLLILWPHLRSAVRMLCYTSHSNYYYHYCYYYHHYSYNYHQYYRENWTSHSSANNALSLRSREGPERSFACDIAMSGQYGKRTCSVFSASIYGEYSAMNKVGRSITVRMCCVLWCVYVLKTSKNDREVRSLQLSCLIRSWNIVEFRCQTFISSSTATI